MTKEYELLDSGYFRRLDRIGDYTIIRPSAAAVWTPKLGKTVWSSADAIFERHSGGDGKWKFKSKSIPKRWPVKIGQVKMHASLTDFGHVGFFPEHHCSMHFAQCLHQFQSQYKRPFKLLNLFAYTGAVSLLAADLGAEVVHVDASKTSTQWARENALLSQLQDKPIRWIVDDVQKFVARELKRGHKYDGIVLDPPSYGRGIKGEIWKIEDHLIGLLDHLSQLASEDFSFIKLSAHTPSYTPITLANLISQSFDKYEKNFKLESFEMTVREKNEGRLLPSGACAVLSRF